MALANWTLSDPFPQNVSPFFKIPITPVGPTGMLSYTNQDLSLRVNQASAINEVLNALKLVQHCPSSAVDASLHKVIGISTQRLKLVYDYCSSYR